MWIKCMLALKQTVLSFSKNGHKSSQTLLKVTPNKRKISFDLLFIRSSDKYPDSFPYSYLSDFVINPKNFCNGFVTSV